MRKALAMVLALAMGTLAGCGLADRAAEKVIEETTGISVDDDGKTITVKGEDGETAFTMNVGGSEVPKRFPLPIYPGAAVTGSSRMGAGAEAVYNVELSYEGDAGPVADFYVNTLKEMGAADEDILRMDNSDAELSSVSITANSPQGQAYIFVQTDKGTQEGIATLSWATASPEN